MDEEQEFMLEAQKVRDEQVMSQGGESGYEPDPAIQDAIDAAASSNVEPGSGEPGFMGLGGLSNSDIKAQQDDIAERARNIGA